VIGVGTVNAFLRVGWKSGDRREAVSLQHVIAHIDYNLPDGRRSWHAGLGTDFDGGFGVQSTPLGIDTIARLAQGWRRFCPKKVIVMRISFPSWVRTGSPDCGGHYESL